MHPVQALKDFCSAQLPRGLEMLRQMVEINSFTTNIAGVNRLGRFTAECFAPLGFSAEFVRSTNPLWGDHLVMTRPGTSGRCLGLVSHLDTVFPPEEEERNHFHWSPEGDRIFGPGTHDIKGGTLMMWLVLSALRAHAPAVFESITWKLLWNSSEECFSKDFGDVCLAHFPPETLAALVFEAEGRTADGKRQLVVARKGRGTWRATASGRAAHAGGKHDHGANAVLQIADTVARIAALTDYAKDLTVNVATVTGGTVLNRVPHEAVAEGEYRAFDPRICAQTRTNLLALNGPGTIRSPADHFPCQVQVEILSETQPWPRNPATDRLFEHWREVGREVGESGVAQERGGLSDGNLLWHAVPTLDGLGPWGDNDHCSERTADGSKLPEFVLVSSFVPKAVWNCLAIIKLVNP